MSKFKVGDWVRVNKKLLPNENHTPYQIAEIFSDSWGDVMLSTVGGSGYGRYYLEKIKLSQWHPVTSNPERDGYYQIKTLDRNVRYAEFWRGEWRNPKTYDHIYPHRMLAWRGLVLTA